MTRHDTTRHDDMNVWVVGPQCNATRQSAIVDDSSIRRFLSDQSGCDTSNDASQYLNVVKYFLANHVIDFEIVDVLVIDRSDLVDSHYTARDQSILFHGDWRFLIRFILSLMKSNRS